MLLTQRTAHLSKHAGQISFPGGRVEANDEGHVAAALREAEEEIGLPPGLVEVIGPLSPLISLHGIKVTPYVGVIPDFVEYQPNDAEIAAEPGDDVVPDAKIRAERIGKDDPGRAFGA